MSTVEDTTASPADALASATEPATEPAPAKTAPVPLRKNGNFLLLWSGAGFSSLGIQLTYVIYPLLVVWHTGSVGAAGFVFAAAVLPHLVVQLPAGAIVDRVDRRRLMILADIGCIVATGSVLVAVVGDTIVIPHLMVVAFIHGSLTIFYELAERTAVPNLVHETQVATALGQNEGRKRSVGMLGDPLGSILFSLVRWVPFLLTVAAHVVSLGLLLLIRKKRFQAENTTQERASIRADIAYGVKWLWNQPFLRTAMLLIAGSNLIFSGMVLALIKTIYDSGTSPAAVGIILAAGGLGGVLGALTGPRWRTKLPMRAILPAALFVWTLSIAPFAYIDDPIQLGALFVILGYVGGALNVIGYVYAVQITPDDVLGRATSVMMLLGSGATFLGAPVAGLALDVWGVTSAVLVMAAAMALLGLIGLFHPALRNAVDVPPGEAPKQGEVTDDAS